MVFLWFSFVYITLFTHLDKLHQPKKRKFPISILFGWDEVKVIKCPTAMFGQTKLFLMA